MASEASAKDYEELHAEIFMHGTVSMALALAQETGMVDILCQATGPLSSSQIAQRGNLRERYVRELVNSLTSAGLVQLVKGTGGEDGTEAQYFVPEHQKPVMAKFGMYSRIISSGAKNFVGIKDCFDLHKSGCMRYGAEQFDIFEKLMVLGLEAATTELLKTPGLKIQLESGIRVLEIGAGKGNLSCHLAAKFPASHFVISDAVGEPLEHAKQVSQREGLSNTTCQILDACDMPDHLAGSFGWVITHDVVHDLPYVLKALQGISKALKPGGNYSLIDEFSSSYVAKNVGKLEVASMYSIGTFYCIPESFQQPDSDALGPCWGEEKARELVGKAGMDVLGIVRNEEMGFLALCMCQKPV